MFISEGTSHFTLTSSLAMRGLECHGYRDTSQFDFETVIIKLGGRPGIQTLLRNSSSLHRDN